MMTHQEYNAKLLAILDATDAINRSESLLHLATEQITDAEELDDVESVYTYLDLYERRLEKSTKIISEIARRLLDAQLMVSNNPTESVQPRLLLEAAHTPGEVV